MSLKFERYFGPRGCILTVIAKFYVSDFLKVVVKLKLDWLRIERRILKNRLAINADNLYNFSLLIVPLNIPSKILTFRTRKKVFV